MHLCTNNISHTMIRSLHSCSAWQTTLEAEVSSVIDVKVTTLWCVSDHSQRLRTETERQKPVIYLTTLWTATIISKEQRRCKMNEMYGALTEWRWHGTKYFQTIRVPLRLRIPYVLVRDWNRDVGVISQLLSALTMQFPSKFPYPHRRGVNVTFFIWANN
jgi:hypothetical protein